jgi:hypothetical protein
VRPGRTAPLLNGPLFLRTLNSSRQIQRQFVLYPPFWRTGSLYLDFRHMLNPTVHVQADARSGDTRITRTGRRLTLTAHA